MITTCCKYQDIPYYLSEFDLHYVHLLCASVLINNSQNIVAVIEIFVDQIKHCPEPQHAEQPALGQEQFHV